MSLKGHCRLSLKDHCDWRRCLRTRGKAMSLLSGKKKDQESYRLVIYTLIPGKVMEQLILKTVYKHMKDRKLIGSWQHDFTKEKHD